MMTRWIASTALRVAFALVVAGTASGCVVYGGRGRGYYGHPHGGPPGHTGYHPGRGHGRGR